MTFGVREQSPVESSTADVIRNTPAQANSVSPPPPPYTTRVAGAPGSGNSPRTSLRRLTQDPFDMHL